MVNLINGDFTDNERKLIGIASKLSAQDILDGKNVNSYGYLQRHTIDKLLIEISNILNYSDFQKINLENFLISIRIISTPDHVKTLFSLMFLNHRSFLVSILKNKTFNIYHNYLLSLFEKTNKEIFYLLN